MLQLGQEPGSLGTVHSTLQISIKLNNDCVVVFWMNVGRDFDSYKQETFQHLIHLRSWKQGEAEEIQLVGFDKKQVGAGIRLQRQRFLPL